MESDYTEQQLKNKTIVQLKEILKSLHLPLSGNKDVLIKRILYQQKSTFKQLNYISSLPSDIQKQTLYSLPYPDAEKNCSCLDICDDKFWRNYIKNQYFINPDNVNMPFKDVAKYAYDILLKFWNKNSYPSWRVLPFIFEVWEPTKKTLPLKLIDKFSDDGIAPFSIFVPGAKIDKLKADFPLTERFWGKEIEKAEFNFKTDNEIIDYMLKECESPTAYWTPSGLQDLNFDIDKYFTLNRLTRISDNSKKDLLFGYFRILIYKKFGFL